MHTHFPIDSKGLWREARLLCMSGEARDRILEEESDEKTAFETSMDQAKAKEAAALQRVRDIREKGKMLNWGDLTWSQMLRKLKGEGDVIAQENTQQKVDAFINGEAEKQVRSTFAAAESAIDKTTTEAQKEIARQARAFGRDVELAKARISVCEDMIVGLDAQIAVLESRKKDFEDMAKLIGAGGLRDEFAADKRWGVLQQEKEYVMTLQNTYKAEQDALTEAEKQKRNLEPVQVLDGKIRTLLESADPTAIVELDDMIEEAVVGNPITPDAPVNAINRLEQKMVAMLANKSLSASQAQILRYAAQSLRTMDRRNVIEYFEQKRKEKEKAREGQELNKPVLRDRVGMLKYMKKGDTVDIKGMRWAVEKPSVKDDFTTLIAADGRRAVVERKEEDDGNLYITIKEAGLPNVNAALGVPAARPDMRKDVLYLSIA